MNRKVSQKLMPVDQTGKMLALATCIGNMHWQHVTEFSVPHNSRMMENFKVFFKFFIGVCSTVKNEYVSINSIISTLDAGDQKKKWIGPTCTNSLVCGGFI